jgi:hypothetical protein
MWGYLATVVRAENLCHQAIFMNHATSAVTPLDPEPIQAANPAFSARGEQVPGPMRAMLAQAGIRWYNVSTECREDMR